MRQRLALVFVGCLIGAATAAAIGIQQARPVSMTEPSIDEVLQAVRSDLQGERAAIIAKNVTLTSAEAARFWPVYDQYQKEQNVIMDDQLKGIQRYIESADTLDDAAAIGLMNAHIDRDARMASLRKKWLGEFQKVVGARLAARVMQIDRRLSLSHQVQFTAKIPLIH